ncbi:putative pentatricopeptide repeat-containing protein At5g52630 [Impatiens glandulifera]|uniref:putative pentatricopeptide repeat-containing protein At5g52630 n=1 Tax=Impatiens glandulifera TaxID=253017 RepID=UPI001FB09CF6|nr:putative pentatricopeptide repeat-containing protein At5g52630 [Impatiens glandulifera]
MNRFNVKKLNLHNCARHQLKEQFHVARNLTDPRSIAPPIFELNRKLNALWKSGMVDEACQLFDRMPNRDEFTWNTMIAAYADSGRFHEARKLFDLTPKKSSITWSSLISAYCRHGYETEVFHLFWEMQYEGHKPNDFTLSSVLRTCSINGLLWRGEQVHAYSIKRQLDFNDFVNTGLVHMYSNCNQISKAENLFQMTSGDHRGHVMWSALISGYTKNGDSLKAINCFKDMQTQGVECNQYTFPSVLTACASISAHAFGMQVHGFIIYAGFETNSFVESALVNMYAKCGDVTSGRMILERAESDDVISWNSMIVGCVENSLEEEALLLFQKMHARDIKFDDFTYPSVLNCYASIKDVRIAKSVHCLITKTGFEARKLVGNALIDMYAKGGDMYSAIELFNRTIEKDVVSWTSLVTGYAHNDFHEEALKLFSQMKRSGVHIDQIVTASVLSSCAELTRLEFGRQIQASLVKSGLGSTLSVDNSLVTMYAKCGSLEEAKQVFDSMRNKNVMTWTALIVGYAQNGRGKDSIKRYNEMIASGVKPDFITFIGLLFACSHAGLVKEAREYFETMYTIYGIKPGPDHYACMIDLLGRCGKLNEAEELLNQMDVEPDSTIWKALLGASRVYGNVELAERAAKALFELEPCDATSYVMLANIYSATGLFENAAKIRRVMKTKGVTKEPGRSWIEMNNAVHTFMSEDRGHPNSDMIYGKVEEIMLSIKRAGYVPDMRFALHDVDEEVKERGLAYHGEKLAVAFGLIFLPQTAPIRIYKNLRVCGDCHTAMKFISSVYGRHIILRDSNCFHHFKRGICSCEDYW